MTEPHLCTGGSSSPGPGRGWVVAGVVACVAILAPLITALLHALFIAAAVFGGLTFAAACALFYRHRLGRELQPRRRGDLPGWEYPGRPQIAPGRHLDSTEQLADQIAEALLRRHRGQR